MDIKPVLFLDLDGTIRESRTGGFIDGPDDVQIIQGRGAVLEKYFNEGWVLIGVTNQGGIAHGHKDPSQVHAENRKTNDLLQGKLKDIYFSPFHEESDHKVFGRASLLRKPHYGMLVQAEIDLPRDHGILPAIDHSLMVGDREEDQKCAEKAGIDFQWAEEFFDDAD